MVRRGRAGVSGCPEHTHCAHSSDGGRGTRGRPPPRPRTIYTRPAPTRPHRSARHAPTARNAHAPPRGGGGRPRGAPAPAHAQRLQGKRPSGKAPAPRDVTEGGGGSAAERTRRRRSTCAQRGWGGGSRPSAARRRGGRAGGV